MTPVVRTEALSKRYCSGGRPVDALRGLTLQIAEGEFVSVMGPSGSGKSTFMHLLGLLDRPSSGHYWLDGEDVGVVDADRHAAIRNRKFGFVFQNFNLLGRNTALENVELPLIYCGTRSAERRRRAIEVLSLVGLDHRSSHWPGHLSGGEQQRVAIARAIVTNPRLILADEPTGALDSATGNDILALFQELNRSGCTIVLVTHDIDIARHAGRLLKLHDGCLISDKKVARPDDARRRPATVDQRPLHEPA